MKYRKKPVVIEAKQFTGEENNAEQLIEWIGKEVASKTPDHYEEQNVFINTLEGQMTASKGDYIIKGVKGEFYPCKPDIFEATYELIEE